MVSGKLVIDTYKIPYAEIKIDGELDDWIGVIPLATDSIGDNNADVRGTDIAKAFLARSDSYLYFRMDFANGKPTSKREMNYECVVWADKITSGGQYFIEIRIQGNDSNVLKPIISIRKLKNNQNTGVSFSENGSLRIGDSFFEARFSFSAFKKYISDDSSYKTEIRSWKGNPENREYDKTESIKISFY